MNGNGMKSNALLFSIGLTRTGFKWPKFDGQEGFVSSGFIYPLDAILSGKDLLPIQWSAYSPFDFSKKTVLGNVTVSRIFMYNSKNQIDKYLLA